MWRMRNKKEYGNNGIDYVPRMRTLRATLGTFPKKLNTRFLFAILARFRWGHNARGGMIAV